jgi:glycosyltransferase involved in cell wall biosynthesis
MDRSRFALQVVALQPTGPLRARYEQLGVPVTYVPIPNLFSPRTVLEGFRLARWLRREAIDVFHSHDVYCNIFGAPWARVAGVPAVVESRRWWGSVPRKGLLTINRLTYRCAHCVTANSPSIARLLVEVDRVSSNRVRVVPNFVDDGAFEPMSEANRRAFLTELGVPSDARVVGVVARLAAVKDHATLLQAVALLRPRWPKLWVVLVGDGETRDSLQADAARLGIHDRVIFAGHQPHNPNLHSLFEISVLCSVDEAFPNSVIEAMAAARPVVATAVGAVPDAVVPGVTGLLVPRAAPRELALALEEILESPDLGLAMGAAGQARAREHYSERPAVASLEALYEELVSANA